MTVEFTPVDCGDMSEIPPDLPAGQWLAVCSVEKKVTNKDKYPMLKLTWKTVEALTDGNENYAGAKCFDWITFFPATHAATRMTRLRLKDMCAALKITIPATTSIQSWEDLAGFIEELDGMQAHIWTTVEIRKDTGEEVTKVRYTAPGASMRLPAQHLGGE